MLGNWLKTTLLMGAIVALFGIIGTFLGGHEGMLLALLIAAGTNIWAYWFSDSLVLKMYDAQLANRRSVVEVYSVVEELAIKAGIPVPKVYIINQEQPNAFATGRNPENAAVAVTTGILRILSHAELRGVIAHELAHIKHRDTLISTICATIAGAISALTHFAYFFAASDERHKKEAQNHMNPIAALLIMIVAPIAAILIQMAISRTREFSADAAGALISNDPISLANALKKIDHFSQKMAMPPAEKHPETAQMMIINPLFGQGFIQSLFRTHPHTAERIARLEKMNKVIYP